MDDFIHVVPEEAYESVRHNMDKVIHTGKSSTAEHSLMLDGVLHHYENRIFPLDDQYLLCMCRDVSQETEMAKINETQRSEIVRLNSLMNDILNNIPVYLFVKDTGNDFRYLYWNKAFAEHSGISVQRAVGSTDADIFPDKKDAEHFREDDLDRLDDLDGVERARLPAYASACHHAPCSQSPPSAPARTPRPSAPRAGL
jgi:PAS domain-containing protein